MKAKCGSSANGTKAEKADWTCGASGATATSDSSKVKMQKNIETLHKNRSHPVHCSASGSYKTMKMKMEIKIKIQIYSGCLTDTLMPTLSPSPFPS